ncbi:MAG: DUF2306 domain-containing protein [Gemmatimonadaceae bacterium]
MKTTKADWLIPGGLVVLSLVPVLASIVRVTQLVGGASNTAENARFFASPLPVLLHIPAAVAYSLLGAFQFSPGFRRRHRNWHRTAGKILVPCGVIVALSGLWMAQFYPSPPGDGAFVYLERLVFGLAMLIAIGFGIDAIRQRNFAEHGAWMTRAYAIGMGAGTQVLTHLPWFMFMHGKPTEGPRAVMMGAGWVINVLVAEWVIRAQPMRSTEPVRHAVSAQT